MSFNRFLFVCFLLPLLLLLGLGGAWIYLHQETIQLDSSAKSLLASDPRAMESFEKVEEVIPNAVLVALELEDLFSNQGAEIIDRASDQIMKVAGARDVKSLTHSGRPVRKGFTLDIVPFIPMEATASEWNNIRDFTTQFPLSRNVLVSEDARYAILVGVFERPLPDHAAREAFRQEFMAAMEEIKPLTNAVHVLAFPFIEAEGVNTITRDLQTYLVVSGILIFLVLLMTFRSLPAVISVLILEGLGVLLLLFIFQLWQKPVDLYTGILFPLIGGLQLTFIIHYLSALQSANRRYPVFQSAKIAFREVFPPSCIAALTTVVGLMTLAFADLSTLADFGRIGASAVVGIFLLTFLLPAVFGLGRVPKSKGLKPKRLYKYSLAVRGASGFSILAFSACLVLAFGILRIRTDIRAVEFIDPGNPIRKSVELLNEDLGGTNIFQATVDTGRERGLQQLPVLKYLENLREYAYTLEGVTDAYAYSQLYLALNQIWDGDNDPKGNLPTNPAKLAMFSQLLNATPLLFEESFVDAEAQSAILILRSKDMPGKKYLALLENFMAYAREQAPEGVSIEPEDGLHTILEADRKIVKNQLFTLGLSIGIIALLLTVLWMSPRHALWVLLANVPALLTIFGMMGYSGYPMNSITIMVAAVILGIAVDDGIHLVSAFRKLRKQGQDAKTAASQALRQKRKPMACTSSILAVFLGLLTLTSFPPVAHFGTLSALGIFAAFLGGVLLLPGFLSRK